MAGNANLVMPQTTQNAKTETSDRMGAQYDGTAFDYATLAVTGQIDGQVSLRVGVSHDQLPFRLFLKGARQRNPRGGDAPVEWFIPRRKLVEIGAMLPRLPRFVLRVGPARLGAVSAATAGAFPQSDSDSRRHTAASDTFDLSEAKHQVANLLPGLMPDDCR
jgi:hypothetical protein